MEHKFEVILDECINRILVYGDTVEDCLKRYPEYSSQLEPELRFVVSKLQQLPISPSSKAKEEGRLRLVIETDSLERQDAAFERPRFRWPTMSLAVRYRWAVVAASVFLAILVGGTSTVAASSGALPGDMLYPVKLASEEVRLALTLSKTSKAKLHLKYAERRVEEAGSLMIKGNDKQLPPTLKRLEENLTAVDKLRSRLSETSAVQDITLHLESSSFKALTRFQSAVEHAPDNIRLRATEAFSSAAESYSNSIEAAASFTADQHIVASPGLLQFWAIDPLPADFEKVLLRIARIEANLVTREGSQWVTIVEQPQTIDLIRLADVPMFLGEQRVRPGTYTKVRISVDKAMAVEDGVPYDIKLPSQPLNLVRPFKVTEGGPTKITLDFLGSASLLRKEKEEFILTPVVMVLIGEPNYEKLSKRDEDREEKRQLRKLDTEGTIEALSSTHLRVKGKLIEVDPEILAKIRVKEGQKVRAEAILEDDGSLKATKVEIINEVDEEEEEELPKIDLRGFVELISPSEWQISGQQIRVTLETEIEGVVQLGALAYVAGRLLPDGSLEADKIRIFYKTDGDGKEDPKDPYREDSKNDEGEQLNEVGIRGTIEAISLLLWKVKGQDIIITQQTDVEGIPAVGFLADIKGLIQPDRKVLALSIKIIGSSLELKKDPDKSSKDKEELPERKEAEPISIVGIIQKIDAQHIQVAGHTVILSSQTRLEGVLTLGSIVEVRGLRQQDARILAESIKIVKSNEGISGDEGSPSDTPTSTSTSSIPQVEIRTPSLPKVPGICPTSTPPISYISGQC